jgi:multidrug efflux system membrane fusion protein
MIADHKPSLQPTPTRGRRWPWILGVVALVGLVAWIWTSTHRGAGHAGGRVGGRPTADQVVPVMVGDVTRADVPLTFSAVGTVEASESVSLRAQTSGTVLAVGFEEGRPVRKGQVLYRLDPAPALAMVRQAEATLARDRAQLAQAQADARRFRALGAQGFVSRQQAEQAGASAAALAATVQADLAQVENARVQLGYATVRSPIDGMAGARLLDVGNVVRAGDTAPLVVINRVTPVMVRFAVPQGEIDRVRRYHAAGPLAVTATPRGGRPHAGKLAFFENAVDPATGTLGMQARFPNADQALVPGQFVDVTVTLAVEKDKVVAPTQAILPAQEGHLAFVLGEGDKVAQRPVRVERVVGARTIVAEGLKPGDKVITDGTLQLRDGAKVEIRTTLVPPSPPPGGRGGRGRGAGGQGQGGGH